MTNFYKKLVKSLLLAGLLVAPLQNYAAAQGPNSNDEEYAAEQNQQKNLVLESKSHGEVAGLDEVTPEALPECITLKFMGSDQSVQVPRGALMRSELGKTAFDENSEETELVLDQNLVAGFTLKELAELLQITDWQKYLENKDDAYLYRLLLVDRYLDIPDLYEALTTQVANIAHTLPAKSQLLVPSSQKPTLEEIRFAQDSAKKVILDRTLVGHTNSVTSVAWSPDGSQIVSSSFDSTVRIWNAATGNLTRTLNGHTHCVLSVAWSPDGSQIVSGSFDNTVRIWNATTGESRTLNGHTNSVLSVAWSPDGKQIVSGSRDKTVRIWDAATGNLIRTLNGHIDRVLSVAWSPNGKQIVSGSWDNTVRIWNAATGNLTRTLNGHTLLVHSVAWSPDGKQIVSGSDDKTVRIWNAATGNLTRTFNGHTRAVDSVAWSPDGSQIVSGSDDSTVRIWNAATGENTKTLNGHTNHVSSVFLPKYAAVAWSPDGKQIVSGSWDNTVRIWNPHIRDSVQAEALLLAWIQAQEFAFEQQKKMSDFITDRIFSRHGLPKVFFKGDQVEIRSTNAAVKPLPTVSSKIKLLRQLKKQKEKIETEPVAQPTQVPFDSNAQEESKRIQKEESAKRADAIEKDIARRAAQEREANSKKE